MRIKKIDYNKFIYFVILIAVIFVICMAMLGKWIYKIKYINLQENEPYINLDVTDSYVKFTTSYWNEDILGTHINEEYITSTKYIVETYYILKDGVVTNKERKEYSVKEEDYKLLLEYLINEKQFFSKIEEADPNPGIVYELEIRHLNQTKSVILSVNEDELIDQINVLSIHILENSFQ